MICGRPCTAAGGILGDLKQFAADQAEFRQRQLDLEISYGQRLRTLVGDVVVPGQSTPEPDIYTFLFPDIDIDGDGVTERDARRAELSALGYDFSSGNKGQIAEQYQVVAAAETRADSAVDQMVDLVRRMEAVELEARELAELDQSVAEDIFERITTDGAQISVLIKQRGYLQQAAADRAARRAKRRSMFGSFFGAAVSIGAAVATGGASIPFTIAAGVGGIMQSASLPSTSGSVAGKVGLIDAQINDIQTLQRADIVVIEAAKQAEAKLIKAKYQVYDLALSQNNLALSYLVAQRDVDRELNMLARQKSEVANLLVDKSRAEAMLRQNNANNYVGWEEVDVRDTLTKSLLIADKALMRAKVWTYITMPRSGLLCEPASSE